MKNTKNLNVSDQLISMSEKETKTPKKENKAKPIKKDLNKVKFNRETPSYKNIGVRFREEEFNAMLERAINYKSVSDYIKSLIKEDIEKH